MFSETRIFYLNTIKSSDANLKTDRIVLVSFYFTVQTCSDLINILIRLVCSEIIFGIMNLINSSDSISSKSSFSTYLNNMVGPDDKFIQYCFANFHLTCLGTKTIN